MFSGLSSKFFKNLKGIFTDIDDTLSWKGKVPPCAYRALWEAKESGLRIILVTGRPAGWADHLVRMWPVDAVVGEGGAFYFYPNEKGSVQQRFLQDRATRQKNCSTLRELFRELKKKYPYLSLASDQNYRETDLAIDFCEDVTRVPNEEIEAIREYFERAGACVKISSIHLNIYFGGYDKYTCCKLLLEERFSENLDAVKDQYIYFGDSPNDEPFFRALPYTVGVANVRNFLPQMKYPPTFIADKEGGEGFGEVLGTIVDRRK